MKATIGVRAVLLQALRAGPGYGRELARRVALLTDGRLQIPEPHVYLGLRALHRLGLVESWAVVPGGARGARKRIYYGLSLEGVAASAAQRATLKALSSAGAAVPAFTEQERRRMAERLLEGEALCGFGGSLRETLRARSRAS